jgi:hypothetical protein
VYPLLLAVTLTLGLAGCDQIRQAINDATAEGDGTTTPEGSGGSTGPVAVGERPAQKTGGATGLIRQVAGGGGPDAGITAGQCADLTDGGPVKGPDCVTQEIKCGDTIVGHTRGGTNLYNTKFYERNTCWPGTRNHNGGDERVYLFVPDKSPRFQAGEDRQRVSVYFDSPCADLTFTKMVGDSATKCPRESAKLCDSANPFTRKMDRSQTNITVDRGEVYFFLVEGADDEEGAFSITLECGT